MGIPHSHFLGGPPEWNDEDRTKARARFIRESRRHGPCGELPEDWRDPTTGEPLTERLPRYPVIRLCRACQVRDAGRYDVESGAVRDLEPGEYLGWRPYDPEEDGP